MKTYTNIFGTKISHKPFYQTSLNTWRIARYENDKLDMVLEDDKSFSTKKECMDYLSLCRRWYSKNKTNSNK